VQSIPDVCEVLRAGPADRPADLLIELPHGATRRAHFDSLRGRLRGKLPDDLVEFFFVNTDAGAPECAAEIARGLAARGAAVLVLRCLIPRTLIDCNRIVEERQTTGQMTPGIAEYVRDEHDVRELVRLHGLYQEASRRAYDAVCGSGGLALALHTYAPRSVQVDRFDEGIVRALRAAYEPAAYERWPRRPDVDAITEDLDGRFLAPPAIVDALEREYRAIGIAVARNATYRLHPESMGHVRAVEHPGRVLCVEINRALLAEPFAPFEEMRIGREPVRRMAAPAAAALAGGIVLGEKS
jgi:hypothetical protein